MISIWLQFKDVGDKILILMTSRTYCCVELLLSTGGYGWLRGSNFSPKNNLCQHLSPKLHKCHQFQVRNIVLAILFIELFHQFGYSFPLKYLIVLIFSWKSPIHENHERPIFIHNAKSFRKRSYLYYCVLVMNH